MMDWKECNDKRLVKIASIDPHLIDSLKISSENRLKTASRISIDQISAATLVSLHYDAMRELLEALAIKNGFKVYNHDCYCSFLKEIIHENLLGESFDRYRKIRNNINYYGNDVEVRTAKEYIKDIIEIIEVLRRLL